MRYVDRYRRGEDNDVLTYALPVNVARQAFTSEIQGLGTPLRNSAAPVADVKTVIHTVGISVWGRASVPSATMGVGLIRDRLTRSGFKIAGYVTEKGVATAKEHRPFVELSVRAPAHNPPCLKTISEITAAALGCKNDSKTLHVSLR